MGGWTSDGVRLVHTLTHSQHDRESERAGGLALRASLGRTGSRRRCCRDAGEMEGGRRRGSGGDMLELAGSSSGGDERAVAMAVEVNERRGHGFRLHGSCTGLGNGGGLGAAQNLGGGRRAVLGVQIHRIETRKGAHPHP